MAAETGGAATQELTPSGSLSARVAAAVDPHASLRDAESAASKIHAGGEVFDEATEHTFTFLQVFTACVSAFGHGANDVANAIAPFATILGLYRDSNQDTPIPDTEVPVWILAFGGGGIVVGLGVLGYRVIRSIGVELIKVTPARGFVIELSSASVIILGSVLGIPLSTTHCQVGAEVGVGALEGKNGVNWRLLVKVFGAWVVTIAVTGTISASLFSFVVYSPSRTGYEGTRDSPTVQHTSL